MQKKKAVFMAATVAVTSIYFSLSAVQVSAADLLKKGMRGSEVTVLQTELKELGYFSSNATGYFGNITETAVKKLQKKYGLVQDGIAGPKTLGALAKLTSSSSQVSSRGAITSSLLKKGMRGSEVTVLQDDLKKLGYFSANSTGYYGNITVASVKALQAKHGLTQDGIAGKNTFSLIERLLGDRSGSTSRGSTYASENVIYSSTDYMMKWFGGVENVLSRGENAVVYDIGTGISFNIKRTYGTNHADCETLTLEDTQIMKKIYGGSWNWNRRPIIVTVDGGTKIAASMAGMPHAGKDNAAANKYISGRSGGYGYGVNLDTVKNNGMDGHFDIHFYGSRTHGTNKVNAAHQNAIKSAAQWAQKNY